MVLKRLEQKAFEVTAVMRYPIKRAKMLGLTTPNFQGVPLQHDATSGLKKQRKTSLVKVFVPQS
jgi:hypothetical protein